MVTTLTLAAPAKINLGLEITGKRPDGYHELATIFQEIALADELELTLTAGGISLGVDDPTLPNDEKNLAFLAAQLFLEKSGQKTGVKIRLKKNIPHGAGLGGGSSDAAAVLKGLNQLFAYPLTAQDLFNLALRLGSDVPFFLGGGTAYATGRGEILIPLAVQDWRQTVIIVKPETSLSTSFMYQNLKLGLTNKLGNIIMLRQKLETGRYEKIATELFNRFEEIAFTFCPKTGIIKERLLAGGCQGALLCGSGSAVFGLIDEPRAARKIREEWEGPETIFITEINR